MKKSKRQRGVFEKDPGSGVWWIRYADQFGRIHREKIGPKGLAISAYQKRKTEVREGRFFPEKMKERTASFSQVAQDFLNYSKRFKRSYGHDVGRMETLLRLWRDNPLSELSPGRIEQDLSECAEQEEWSPATYNRYRTLVSGVFSLAIRNGKATVNPVRGTKHRIENNTRVRYLTDQEEGRLTDYVRATCPEREAEILVALHSGMRRSEQYLTPACLDGGLKWEHIDFGSGIITIPRSKHGESRHIPMNSVLRETLLKLKASSCSPYVFPVNPPDKWFPIVLKGAAIDDFSWHCHRHTFASRLVMAGVDIRTVQELLGHKSIVTTMRYAHLTPRHQAEAVERLVGSTSTGTGTRVPKEHEGELVEVA